MPVQTFPWDAADALRTKEDIARSRGMTEIARATGLGRANLYEALSPGGNPEFATVTKVLRALGVRLTIAV
jgi:probable addiction module antidote protein